MEASILSIRAWTLVYSQRSKFDWCTSINDKVNCFIIFLISFENMAQNYSKILANLSAFFSSFRGEWFKDSNYRTLSTFLSFLSDFCLQRDSSIIRCKISFERLWGYVSFYHSKVCIPWNLDFPKWTADDSFVTIFRKLLDNLISIKIISFWCSYNAKIY